ncbi:hypothetical protein JCM24511_00103 [Saitozyma sp. JCM 24511]|nr:hypothetical protein JCM24511_00103 [Saitozyma sp. JCM 24511]
MLDLWRHHLTLPDEDSRQHTPVERKRALNESHLIAIGETVKQLTQKQTEEDDASLRSLLDETVLFGRFPSIDTAMAHAQKDSADGTFVDRCIHRTCTAEPTLAADMSSWVLTSLSTSSTQPRSLQLEDLRDEVRSTAASGETAIRRWIEKDS